MKRHLFHYILSDDVLERFEMMYLCRALAYSEKCDQLDMRDGWSRKPTTMTFDKIMDMSLTSQFNHFSIQKKYDIMDDVEYLNIGLKTNNRPREPIDYFIWLRLDKKYLKDIISTYKIKIRDLGPVDS